MLSPDQSRFLRLCQEHDVRALVIGGKALVAHGLPRTTADLDLLVGHQPEEAEALAVVWRAMEPACDFDAIRRAASQPRRQLVYCPGGRHEMDILTSIEGIDFAEAFGRGDRMLLGGVSCVVAAAPDLLSMKRASQLVHERDGETALAARDGDDIAMLERLADERWRSP